MSDSPAPPAAEPTPAEVAPVAVPNPDAPPDARSGAGRVAPAVGGDPFSAAEYRQFAEEDGRAGRFIGWLLCALFVYTILVASAAIWWTLHAV